MREDYFDKRNMHKLTAEEIQAHLSKLPCSMCGKAGKCKCEYDATTADNGMKKSIRKKLAGV